MKSFGFFCCFFISLFHRLHTRNRGTLKKNHCCRMGVRWNLGGCSSERHQVLSMSLGVLFRRPDIFSFERLFLLFCCSPCFPLLPPVQSSVLHSRGHGVPVPRRRPRRPGENNVLQRRVDLGGRRYPMPGSTTHVTSRVQLLGQRRQIGQKGHSTA